MSCLESQEIRKAGITDHTIHISFGQNLITYRQLQDVEDFVHNDDVQNSSSVNKKRKGAFDGTFHTEQSSQHLSGSMLTLSLQIK